MTLLWVVLSAVLSTSVATFELTVLHVNDIHVRIEETNQWSGNCREGDKGTRPDSKKSGLFGTYCFAN